MNKKAFSLGLVISLISMFMVITYIEDQSKSLTKKFGLEKTVVIASQDIQELEMIDDSKVTLKTVPASFRALSFLVQLRMFKIRLQQFQF